MRTIDYAASELFRFRPARGTFDTKAVAAKILSMGSAAPDPLEPGVFLVTTSPEVLQYALDARRQRPREFPYIVVVRVAPGEVSVPTQLDEEHLRLARQLMEWILASYDCQVADEYGNPVEIREA